MQEAIERVRHQITTSGARMARGLVALGVFWAVLGMIISLCRSDSWLGHLWWGASLAGGFWVLSLAQRERCRVRAACGRIRTGRMLQEDDLLSHGANPGMGAFGAAMWAGMVRTIFGGNLPGRRAVCEMDEGGRARRVVSLYFEDQRAVITHDRRVVFVADPARPLSGPWILRAGSGDVGPEMKQLADTLAEAEGRTLGPGGSDRAAPLRWIGILILAFAFVPLAGSVPLLAAYGGLLGLVALGFALVRPASSDATRTPASVGEPPVGGSTLLYPDPPVRERDEERVPEPAGRRE